MIITTYFSYTGHLDIFKLVLLLLLPSFKPINAVQQYK